MDTRVDVDEVAGDLPPAIDLRHLVGDAGGGSNHRPLLGLDFELAESVRFSRSGLTRMVDRLAADGLLERQRGSSDPHQVFATITERGLERVAEAAPTHLAGVREMFIGRLTSQQTEQLERIWKTLLEGEPTSDRVAE